MAIRERGNSYQADLTIKGKRYRGTFVTRDQAITWEAEVRAAVLAGREPPSTTRREQQPMMGAEREGVAMKGGLTLREAARKCQNRYWTGEECSENHARTVSFMILEMEKFFGADTVVAALTESLIDSYKDYCRHIRKNTNATLNRKMVVLGKILRYCTERGHLKRKPKIELSRETRRRVRWLSKEEENAFLVLFRQWGKLDHVDALTVLVDTGLRNSELWRMEARDVDLKANVLQIWKNKTDHPRAVPMTARVQEVIKRRVKEYSSGRLFPKGNNDWFLNVWDRARDILGFADDPDMIPYICRHTCASRLIQNGVSIPVIQKWLGHKNIQMTMRYAILAPHNLTDAVLVLERLEIPSQSA